MRASGCAIEIDKDHFSQSQESNSPSADCEDRYDDKHNCIDEEGTSCAEEYPSDFKEWLNFKKSKCKGRLKSYSD